MQGQLSRVSKSLEQTVLAFAERGLAIFQGHGGDCHGVYCKHQDFSLCVNGVQITRSLKDLSLDSRGVHQFSKWVDVIEKSLPEKEDVRRLRMEVA